MRCFLVSLLLSLLGASLALAAPPVELTGSWVWAGADSERQAREDAIDATVDTMKALMRPFARKIMHHSIVTTPGYTLELKGDRFTLREDGEELEEFLVDGLWHLRDSLEGKHAEVRARWEGMRLITQWRRDDSSGSNTWWREGSLLKVERIINAEQFGTPVRFVTSYKQR